MSTLSANSKTFSYDLITEYCNVQIAQLMVDARGHAGLEAQLLRERAFGVYEPPRI